MNTKRRYFKAIAGLGAGAVILSCAVFANYDNANSYNNCKTAVKNVLYAENKSLDYSAEIKLDNEKLLAYYGSYKMNTKGNPSLRYENTYEMDGNIYFSLSQKQDDKRISMGSYSGRKYGYYSTDKSKTNTLVEDMNNSNGKNFGDKMVNFIETMADLMVVDLKNNLVLTNTVDGMSEYSISLTRDQMPAFVNSGVSLAASAISSNVSRTVIDSMKDDMMDENSMSSEDKVIASFFGSGEPYVKGVKLNVWVDKDNNPGNLSCEISFGGFDENGKEHIASLSADLSFYDFGSTVIERISDEEVSALERLNSEEYYITYGTESDNVSVDTEVSQ